MWKECPSGGRILLEPEEFLKILRLPKNSSKRASMLFSYIVPVFGPPVTLTVTVLYISYLMTSIRNTVWKQPHHPWSIATLTTTPSHLRPVCDVSCSGGGVSVWRQLLTQRTHWWLIVVWLARIIGTPLKANMCHSFYCEWAPLLFLPLSRLCLHFSKMTIVLFSTFPALTSASPSGDGCNLVSRQCETSPK